MPSSISPPPHTSPSSHYVSTTKDGLILPPNLAVEPKCKILRYLLHESALWKDTHDTPGLLYHVKAHCEDIRGTSWQGQVLSVMLHREELLWESERCGRTERRPHHEVGSEYERLMSQWSKTRSKMEAASWQQKWDQDEIDWAEIPEKFLSDAGANGFHVYEYNGDELQRIVDQAVADAEAAGMHKNAKAVRHIYFYSLHNSEARLVLDKVLGKRETPEELERFQAFVLVAQKDKKRMKIRGNGSGPKLMQQSSVQSLTQSPPNQRATAVEQDTTADSELDDKSNRKRKRTGIEESDELCCPRDCKCLRCSNDIKRQDTKERKICHEGSDKSPTRLTYKGQEIEKIAEEQAQDIEMQVLDDILTLVDDVEIPRKTAKRLPHPDPLVTKILGDLQYEPSALKLLKPFETQLPASELVESTLRLIKTIFTESPQARTDIGVLTERVEEMEKLFWPKEGLRRPCGSAKKDDKQRDEIGNTVEEEETESEYEPVHEDLPAKPSAKRTRRMRRPGHWPCPVADETGCQQVFSRTCHAKRHYETVHNPRTDIHCPYCSETFARRDYLETHGRRYHKRVWGR